MTAQWPTGVCETHSGIVLLYGDRAYKAKKPITTDFLDFGTPDRRAAAIARELDLNRRLSPDVYLGVGHFHDPLSGAAEPILIMRRLPDAARLSRVLDDPAAAWDALTTLTATLATFHDKAPRSAAIRDAARVPAVRERWHQVSAGLTTPIESEVSKQIIELADRYLDGRTALFDGRIAEDRIIDGHGDLHAQDIFLLPDGFRIIDCLDFDDRLRHIDRLDDIAFLAMDIEFLGHPELATMLIDRYRTTTADTAPTSLHQHYIAYRAAVRAKVNCIRYGQGDATSGEHAVRHADIALRHLSESAVRLALIGGLPGTGKSTVAHRLAAATGAVVLSSDHTRASLRASGEMSGVSGELNRGAYTPAARDLVYTRLFERARVLLGEGRSVILDASWADPAQRRRASELAAETTAAVLQLECQAPQSIALDRIRARTSTESDATPAIAAALATRRPPWPDASPLDTTAPLATTLDNAIDAWQAVVDPIPGRNR